MTREHKLSLIVAFAVVLAVSVLISDHFSTARSAQMGSGAAGEPATIGRPSEAPILDPGFGSARPSAGLADHAAGPVLELLPNRASPAEIVMGAPVGGAGAGGIGPDGVRTARTVDELAAMLGSEVRPGGPRGGEAGRSTIIDPLAGAGSPSASGVRVSPGAVKRYEVKSNDNMTKIAKQHYGDGTLWRKLAAYNKGRVGTEGEVRSGVTLMIPPKDVLLGEAVLTPERGAAAPLAGAASAGGSTAKPPAAEASGTYTVQKGEYLGIIAQRLLGSSKRWKEIYELNKDVIDDPDNVPAGTKLKMPRR